MKTFKDLKEFITKNNLPDDIEILFEGNGMCIDQHSTMRISDISLVNYYKYDWEKLGWNESDEWIRDDQYNIGEEEYLKKISKIILYCNREIYEMYGEEESS